MIKSVLASLLIYYISLFYMPKGVMNLIMFIKCKFIWSSNSDMQKMHKLVWNMVIREQERGGLVIRLINAKDKALFLFK